MGTSSLWLVPPADPSGSAGTVALPGPAAALEGVPASGCGRVPAQTRRTVPDLHRPPLPRVLILGAAGACPRDVALALLDTAEPGIARLPQGPSWTVFQFGATAVRSYVPGQRRPRTVPIASFAAGAQPAKAIDKPRPPRRIEVDCPSAVLAGISLVLAPELGADDHAGADLAMDAVARSDAVVFVVGSAPLGRTQIEVLRQILASPVAIALVFAAGPDCAGARAAGSEPGGELEACRSGLITQEPDLERAPWFWMDGAEGLSIGQLRSAVASVAVVAEPPAPVSAVAAAPAVPPGESNWRSVLESEIEARRTRAGHRMSIELATLHVRCVQELGSGGGAQAVPAVLDRELHALAVRTTRRLERDVAQILRVVGSNLLGTPVDGLGFARLATAVRRAVVESCEPQQQPHALLLTMTAGVATVTGRAAADSLCALGMPDPEQPRSGGGADRDWVGQRDGADRGADGHGMADSLFWPVGIALAGSCYQLWHGNGAEQHVRCQGWVQQAIWGAERELLRESGERYALLGQAIAIVAEDAVEHGFLLL